MRALFTLSILLAAAIDPGPAAADPVVITDDVKVPPGPEYLHDAVFYQIYPQTFFDSDADGIVLVMMNPAARESTAKFSLRPIAIGHELLAGRAPQMDYADGDYEVSMAGQTYAIYRLVR